MNVCILKIVINYQIVYALNINQTSKYKSYKKEVHDLYRKALPHLNKYVELNPEDEANKRVLNEIKYKLENQ